VAWGSIKYGQSTVPSGLSNVVAIAVGYFYNLALKADGTVVPWGQYLTGGNGAANLMTVPGDLANVVAVSAGKHHGLALKANGALEPLGDTKNNLPTIPGELVQTVTMAAGLEFTAALGANNQAPSLATVASFNGYWDSGRVKLEWTSVAEFWTLGYNVYAELPDGSFRRVNTDLVLGCGNPLGGSYSIEDTAAQQPSVLTYWLEEIDYTLKSTWYDQPAVVIRALAGAAGARMTGQGLQLTFSGRVGADYEVEVTDDLASGVWEPLTTGVAQANSGDGNPPGTGGGINPTGPTEGRFTVMDPAALGKPMRFYRAWSR